MSYDWKQRDPEGYARWESGYGFLERTDMSETFIQFRRRINRDYPKAHLTYSESSVGVTWAEAWESGTNRTIETWQPQSREIVNPPPSDAH